MGVSFVGRIFVLKFYFFIILFLDLLFFSTAKAESFYIYPSLGIDYKFVKEKVYHNGEPYIVLNKYNDYLTEYYFRVITTSLLIAENEELRAKFMQLAADYELVKDVDKMFDPVAGFFEIMKILGVRTSEEIPETDKFLGDLAKEVLLKVLYSKGMEILLKEVKHKVSSTIIIWIENVNSSFVIVRSVYFENNMRKTLKVPISKGELYEIVLKELYIKFGLDQLLKIENSDIEKGKDLGKFWVRETLKTILTAVVDYLFISNENRKILLREAFRKSLASSILMFIDGIKYTTKLSLSLKTTLDAIDNTFRNYALLMQSLFINDFIEKYNMNIDKLISDIDVTNYNLRLEDIYETSFHNVSKDSLNKEDFSVILTAYLYDKYYKMHKDIMSREGMFFTIKNHVSQYVLELIEKYGNGGNFRVLVSLNKNQQDIDYFRFKICQNYYINKSGKVSPFKGPYLNVSCAYLFKDTLGLYKKGYRSNFYSSQSAVFIKNKKLVTIDGIDYLLLKDVSIRLDYNFVHNAEVDKILPVGNIAIPIGTKDFLKAVSNIKDPELRNYVKDLFKQNSYFAKMLSNNTGRLEEFLNKPMDKNDLINLFTILVINGVANKNFIPWDKLESYDISFRRDIAKLIFEIFKDKFVSPTPYIQNVCKRFPLISICILNPFVHPEKFPDWTEEGKILYFNGILMGAVKSGKRYMLPDKVVSKREAILMFYRLKRFLEGK